MLNLAKQSANTIAEMLGAYGRQSAGTIAIAFAVMVPVLVGSAGLALDLGQSYLVKQRLAGALDSAALAATASKTTEADILERVTAFMEANYPDTKIGNLVIASIDVSINGDDVTVSATANYDTTFMRLIGRDHITISESTTIHRAIKGLEVVLVLDNTGSMGTSNMNALKTASNDFVETLFNRAQDPGDIKIGLVPYSTAVRVGRYGLGQYPDGTSGYGDPFVTLPAGVSYTNSHDSSSGWYGCVVEFNGGDSYDASATQVANSRGTLWSTAADGLCTSASNCRGHGWDPSSDENDPYPDDVNDSLHGPWDIYSYGFVINQGQECSDFGWSNSRCSNCTGSGGNCNSEYCFCWYSQPNIYCPYANLVPLTSDEQTLYDAIGTMQHHGATLSNVGMAWGMRVLSPEPPFEEGAAWDDAEWIKAVVMMTDGQMSIDNAAFTAYHDADMYRDSITNSELETRLLETCSLLKQHNVVIYTITFDHATSDIDADTKAIYEQCATSPDHYYDAPSQEELSNVFEEISGALARLHISQ